MVTPGSIVASLIQQAEGKRGRHEDEARRGLRSSRLPSYDLSGSKHDEKGTEVPAGALYERDPRAIGQTSDRARSVEFGNLGSRWVARLHGYHRLSAALGEKREAFGTLQRERR